MTTPEEQKNEGPMMPVLRIYVQRLEKEWPHVKQSDILLSAALLTATDTILRYADYMVRMANAPEETSVDPQKQKEQ